jgi:hypothetical protein
MSTCGDIFVTVTGGGERLVCSNGDEGVQPGIQLADGFERIFGEALGADGAGRNFGRKGTDRGCRIHLR